MKLKKLLALALAGVLALALLTGCSSSGKSEDRIIAENYGSAMHDHLGCEVTYDIPELRRVIQPRISSDWISKDENGRINGFNADAVLENGQTVRQFLEETLSEYSDAYVTLGVIDSTGYSAYSQSLMFSYSSGVYSIAVYSTPSTPSTKITKANVEVCHKTLDGREYCFMLLIYYTDTALKS